MPSTTPRPPARRGRPPGRTVTETEGAILRAWAQVAGVEATAARLGITRQQFSPFLAGRRGLHVERWYDLLRIVLTDGHTLMRLDALGTPQTRDDIRTVQRVRLDPVPVAGRGRATAVSVA